MEYVEGYPAIIPCPNSLKLHWYRTIKQWLPHLKGEVINGKSTRVSKGADFYVINYDVIGHHRSALIKLKPKMLIPDEFHYCKNGKAQRTKAVKDIANVCEYVLGLTGTAVLNRPFELVSQLEILSQLDKFGGFWRFVRRYCNAHQTAFGWDFTGHSNLEELNTKLRLNCYIRRRKIDVLKDLPPKQRVVIPFEISNRKEYDSVSKNFIEWIRDCAANETKFLEEIAHLPDDEKYEKIAEYINSEAEKAKRAEQLVKMEALKQLAVKGKMASIKEWIDNFLESGEKLVVFANHISTQKWLLEEYPQAAHIFGSDSTEVRQENVDRFQNDNDCKLIICSLVAGGVGITLTASSNVAFIELGWTPSLHEQAEDRIHRITQTMPCTAYYFIAADTVEDEIYKLILSKEEVTDKIHNGTKDGVLVALLNKMTKEGK
jgi:SNF2 family DNA or RNA helicase